MAERWIDSEQLLEEHLKDPDYRAEWERTALAHAVAIAVMRYRAERGLSLRALAKQLGVTHPQVVRLESGDHNPSVETLQRLAAGLGIGFFLAIAPASRAAQVVAPPDTEVLTDVTLENGTRMLTAAG